MARLKKVTVKPYRSGFTVDYYGWDGKRSVRKVFKTRSEAEDERLRVIARLSGALVVKPTEKKEYEPVLIKDVIRKYANVINAKRIGETAKIEAYHFEQLYFYLLNECGLSFLHQVTREHMQTFQSQLLVGWGGFKTKKASTVNRMFNTYRAFFGNCVVWEHIPASPVARWKKLPVNNKQVRLWTKDDMKAAEEKLPNWVLQALTFMNETGARPVEVSRLTYGDIDLERRLARLVSHKGGKTREDFQPLPQALVDLLHQMQKQARKQFRARAEDIVFRTPAGTPVTKQNLRNALVRVGLGGKGKLNPYGLRHSYITGLVDMNVHAGDVQMLARHADFKTTTNYTHRRNDRLHEAVEQLSKRRIEAAVLGEKEGEEDQSFGRTLDATV